MNDTRENLDVRCSDCGKSFIFTIGEQLFYERKALSRPRRCPTCRKVARSVEHVVSPERVRERRWRGPHLDDLEVRG